MIADMKDRNALKRTLHLCAHPFDMTSHNPSVLMNIYTDEISPDKSNVHKSVEIWNKQMKEFQKSLPNGNTSQTGHNHREQKDKGTSG